MSKGKGKGKGGGKSNDTKPAGQEADKEHAEVHDEESEQQPAAKASESNDEVDAEEEASETTAETTAKKKKKRSRKKGSMVSEGAGAAAANVAAPTEDAAERFSAAINAVHDDSELWADCSRCGVAEKKLRKLLAALRAEPQCSLTSIDLSYNQITDGAAMMLLSALSEEPTLCAGLVELSLVGNPLTVDGIEACTQAATSRSTIELKLPSAVDVTPMPVGGGAACADRFSAYFASREKLADRLSAPPPPPLPKRAASADATSGMGGMGMEGEGEGEDEGAAAGYVKASSTLTFEEATTILVTGKVTSVETTDALDFLLETLKVESAQIVGPANCKLLPRAMRWLSHQLPLLSQLLRTEPPSLVAWTGSRLGSHRLRIVDILDAMLNSRRPTLTHAIAANSPNIICEAVWLLKAHANCGIFHQSLRSLVSRALENRPLRNAMVVAPQPQDTLQAILCDLLLAPSKRKAASSQRGTAVPDAPTTALANAPVSPSLRTRRFRR
uniref:Uncharacterized protein n=1 Tax=Chrysotila carterae TaxID=13221 RepID=A0A7S4BG39_CHRCT